MAMNDTFMDALADHGASLITHIALFDDTGSEVSGGSYARQAVSWNSASNGQVTFSSDLTFQVPGGTTVAGWRAFDASTGGTNYGGPSLTNETFSNSGEYVLTANNNGIDLNAA